MNFQEMNKLDVQAIREKVYTYRKALFNLRCQKKINGQLNDMHEPRHLRKDIARLKTILNVKKGKK